MSLEADLVIARQHTQRRLNFWRVAAVVAIVGIVLVASHPTTGGGFGKHIERYRIAGLIGSGHEAEDDLAKLGEDSSVAAVLLHLDTPGGAVTGGEGINAAVRALAAKKPVVAVMEGTAASAGYMIAVATPHIVARESTLTGSIGVILETTNVGGLLDKIGVTMDPLVSGPLKGEPSFTKPMSPAGRQVLQAIVADLYDQFVGLVATGRHMDPAKVRELADGRAYTGRQARQNGLVDEIGGDDEARRWLEKNRGITPGLPVTEPDKRSWTQRLAANSLSGIITSAEQSLRVDGAWAVWQPFGSRE